MGQKPGDPVIDGQTTLLLGETTTPSAVADHGQLYTKSDDNWYFQDGAGLEHRIVPSDYASIFVDGGGATDIALQHGFELVQEFNTDAPELVSNGDAANNKITIGATGDYAIEFCGSVAQAAGASKEVQWFVFEVAAATSAITSTTEDNPVAVNATGHGFTTSQKVKIAGVTTADELNDRIFTVTRINDNQFTLQEDNGGNVSGAGFGVGSGGTAQLVTQLNGIHSHREMAAGGDVGSMAGCGIASLTKDNAIELYVKNVDDAQNITHEAASLSVKRV